MTPAEEKMGMEEKGTGNSYAAPHMSEGMRIVGLAVGDALVFLIFAAIGRGNHGETTGLAALPEIVLTALPFAVGWFVVAPLLGAYRRELMAQPRKMALRTLLAWIPAWLVGMALRGIFVDHKVPPVSFAVVVLVVNAVLLLVWRWPYALNNSQRRRR